jgi:hypothetical protein
MLKETDPQAQEAEGTGGWKERGRGGKGQRERYSEFSPGEWGLIFCLEILESGPWR